MLAGLGGPALAGQNGPWQPQIRAVAGTNGKGGNAAIELFAPLVQTPDSTLFLDLRLSNDFDDDTEANIGLGVRRIVNPDLMLGGYGYVGVNRVGGHRFTGATFGVEAIGPVFDAHVNLHVPISGARSTASSSGSLSFVGNRLIEQIATLNRRDYAMWGVEGEVGMQAPIDLPDGHGLRLHVGGYHFWDGDGGGKSISGAKAGFEYSIGNVFGGDSGASLTFGGEVRYDNRDQTELYGSVRLSVPLGKVPEAGDEPPPVTVASKGLQRRLNERVRGDIGVRMDRQESRTATSRNAINTATNREYGLFFFADGENTLGLGTLGDPTTLDAAITNAGEDGYVVVLGGSGDLTTVGATLSQGQTLIGGGGSVPVSLINGVQTVASFGGTNGTIRGTDAGTPVITLAGGTTVSGITITGGATGILGNNVTGVTLTNVTVTGAGGDGAAFSGTSAVTASNFTSSDNGGSGLALTGDGIYTFGGTTTLSGNAVDGFNATGNGTYAFATLNASDNDDDGVDITSVTGRFSTTGGTISGNGDQAVKIDPIVLDVILASITHSGGSGGITLDDVSGTFQVTGATTISGTTGAGISISNSSAAIRFGGSVSVSNTGGGGISVADSAGSLRFDGATSIANAGGAGISIDSSSTGVTFSGATSVTNAGGSGIAIASSTGSVTFAGATAVTNAGVDGISLTGNSGGVTFGGATTITNPGAAGVDIEGTNRAITFADLDIALSTTGTTGLDLSGAVVGGNISIADFDLTSTTATGTVGIDLSGATRTGASTVTLGSLTGNGSTIAGVETGVQFSSTTSLAFTFGDGEAATDVQSSISATRPIDTIDTLPVTGTYNFLDVALTGDTSNLQTTLSVYYVDNFDDGVNDGSRANPGSIAGAAASTADVIVLVDRTGSDVIDVGAMTLQLDNGQRLVSFLNSDTINVGGGAPVNFLLTGIANGTIDNPFAGLGTAPTLTADAGFNTVTLGDGNLIEGVRIVNGAGDFSVFGNGSAGGTISGSEIGGLGVTNASGTLTVTDTLLSHLSVSGGSVDVTGMNVDICNCANVTTVSVTDGHTGAMSFDAASTIGATGGSGLVFDNADGSYQFAGATFLLGTDSGIEILNGSGGSFSFGADTFIVDTTGIAFRMADSSGSVTYDGVISQNNVAGAILITGSDGSDVTFNGMVQADTGAAGAIAFTSNGGAQLSFLGGLEITTTTGTGLLAEDGGTLRIASASEASTIFSAAGGAVDLWNVTADVTLDTVLGSGTTALALEGVAGSFAVIGTTTAADTTGAGIRLEQNSADVTFGGLVSVTNAGANGIEISGATGPVSFAGGASVTGAAGNGIAIVGSSAAVSFNGASVTDAGANGISLTDNSGAVTFDGTTTITNPGAAAVDVAGTNGPITLADIDIALGTNGSKGLDLSDAVVGGDISVGDFDLTSTTATGTVGVDLAGTTRTGTSTVMLGSLASDGSTIAGVETGVQVSTVTDVAFIFGDGEAVTDVKSSISATRPIDSTDSLPVTGTYNFLDATLTGDVSNLSTNLTLYYVDNFDDGVNDGSLTNPGTVAGAAASSADVIVLLDRTGADVIDAGGTTLQLDNGQRLVSFRDSDTVNIGGGAPVNFLLTGVATGTVENPFAGVGTAPTLVAGIGINPVTLGDANVIEGVRILGDFASSAVFGNGSAGGTISASDISSLTVTNGSGTMTLTNTAHAQLTVSGGSLNVMGVQTEIGNNANTPTVSVTDGHTGTLSFDAASFVVATNGSGLQFSNADGTYLFAGTTTLNGGDAGIDILNGSSGSFSFGPAASIVNPTGVAFNVNFSSATVTYDGTITQNNPASAVEVANSFGSTVTINGLVTANTGTEIGVRYTNNVSGEIAFLGGLAISTTTGMGLLAQGAGTVRIADTAGAETISSSVGNALRLDNVTADITLDSISGSGVSPVALFQTAGTFTVTGTTTVSNTFADAIALLQNSTAVTFGGLVSVTNSLGAGIFIGSSTGPVNFAGGAAISGTAANGITLQGNSGAVTFDGTTTITSPNWSGVDIGGTNGAISFADLDIALSTNNSSGLDLSNAVVAGNISIADFDVTSTTATGTAGVNLSGTTSIGGATVMLGSPTGNGSTIAGVQTGVRVSSATNIDFTFGDGEAVTDVESSISATRPIDTIDTLPLSGSYNFLDVALFGDTSNLETTLSVYYVDNFVDGVDDGSRANPGSIAGANASGADVIVLVDRTGADVIITATLQLDNGQRLVSFLNSDTVNVGGGAPANFLLTGVAGGSITNPFAGVGTAPTLQGLPITDVVRLGNGNVIEGARIVGVVGSAVIGIGSVGGTITGSELNQLTVLGGAGTLTLTDTQINQLAVVGGSVNVTGVNVDITNAANQPAVSALGGHVGTMSFDAASTITATNGTGLQFENADGTYQFAGTTTLSGGDAGIDILNGSAGTFTFGAGTSILNPSGVAFNMSDSPATVTYDGTITQNNAATAVQVSNSAASDVTFNGLVTANTGSAHGISLSNNAGGETAFLGGLAISTTTGRGISAQFGGTVRIAATGGAETIASSAGRAVDLSSTTLDMTLDSISGSGDIGIWLSQTSGSFAVSGTTTVANTTGTGIVLTSNSAAVTFDGPVSVTDPAGAGIFISSGIAPVTFGGGVTITNPGSYGILLSAYGGAMTFDGTTTIINPAMVAVDIEGVNGAITFADLDIALATNNSIGLDLAGMLITNDISIADFDLTSTTATGTIGVNLAGSVTGAGATVTLGSTAGNGSTIAGVQTGVQFSSTNDLDFTFGDGEDAIDVQSSISATRPIDATDTLPVSGTYNFLDVTLTGDTSNLSASLSIYYVDNFDDGVNDGSSARPGTIAGAIASGSDAIVLVNNGGIIDAASLFQGGLGTLTLAANQRLYSFNDGDTIALGGGAPASFLLTGINPGVITNPQVGTPTLSTTAGGQSTVTLASGNLLQGVVIANGPSGYAITGSGITDLTVAGSSLGGVNLQTFAGTGTFTDTPLTRLTVQSGMGSLSFDAASPLTQTGAVSAVSIVDKSGGSVTFDGLVTANTPLANPIVLTGNAGAAIAFNGGLDIDTTTGTGFTATSGGIITVAATAGDESVTSTGGRAILLADVTANVNFDSVTSGGSAVGIALSTVGGTFNVSGATIIDDASAGGIQITNSSVNATFGGKVTVLNDGPGADGHGIWLQNNTGTYSFNGGVDITVNGVGAYGLRAQSSGTVNILDPDGTNQITSTNGPAILVNPTTVNATFQNVTAGGGTGVSLTGMTGSLTINGTLTIDGAETGLYISNAPGSVTIDTLMMGNYSGLVGIDISGTNGAINVLGGSVTDADASSGTMLRISGGAGTVNFSADLNLSSPSSTLIDIDGRTGGTVNIAGDLASSGATNGIIVANSGGGVINFSGGSKSITSTSSAGVFLGNNTGATINFTGGGLVLSTQTEAAFWAAGGGTLTVQGAGNTITTATGTAVHLDGVTVGAGNITFASTTKTTTGGTSGILMSSVTGAGTVNLGTGSLAGGTGATVRIGNGLGGADTGGTAGLTYAGSIASSTGNRTIDIQDRSVGAGDITLSGNITHTYNTGIGILLNDNAAGTITFSGASKSITTTVAAGISINNTGATVDFTNGGLVVSTQAGAGFNVAGSGTLNVSGAGNSVTTATGAAFQNLSGNATVTMNAALTATGAASVVNIQSRTGNTVTLSGNISNIGVGAAGIQVQNLTGGTINFSGASKQITTTGNFGVTLANNTGSTVNFTNGGLVINTTTGMGFVATGGGTVTVQGSGNTITSGTGRAVRLVSTNIGAAGLTFQSISSNGAVHGIELVDTGTGALAVTGIGSVAGSGGTITNTTNHGISLTNASNTSLSNMIVSNTGGSGINAVNGANLTLTGTQVNNAGNADNEYGLNVVNTIGTVLLSGASFNNAADNLVYVTTTGALNFTVDNNSSFSYPAIISGTANSAILLESSASGAITASIQNSTFTNIVNASAQIGAISAAATGTQNFTFSNNTVNVTLGGRASGVVVGGQGSTTTNITIHNNQFTGAGGNGVITIDTNDSGTTLGNITNNTITNSPGHGMFIAVDESGTSRIRVDGNTIINSGGDGIIGANFGGVGVSTMDLIVTNNIVNGNGLDNAQAFLGGIAFVGFEDNSRVAIRGNVVTGTVPGVNGRTDYYLENQAGTVTFEEVPNTGATVLDVAYLQSINNAGTVTIFGAIDLSNGVAIPLPMMAAPGGVAAEGEDLWGGVLSGATLDSLISAAIERWAAAGITDEQFAVLNSATFGIADLGTDLGLASGSHVQLDDDGAGHGWFVDLTPQDDAEFANRASETLLFADGTQEPAGQYDLLTVIMHEMGHMIGYGDTYVFDQNSMLMYGWLGTGERRLPETIDGFVPNAETAALVE